MATPAPPRPFLTREQMEALSDEEKARAIAEWSSYNARLRLEQQRAASRGSVRGARGRGWGGRGRGYSPAYHPYSNPRFGHQTFQNRTATFNSAGTSASSSTEHPSSPATRDAHIKHESKPPMEMNKPCPAFTSTGICKRSRCAYTHDPDKTAICKPFLFKGHCPKGSACPLSHKPSANRSPHCIHFQEGNCSKQDCPYAHVHVGADAPVCEAFARLGYCEKGAECAERHAFECPDFANKGSCELDGCRLPHIRHAGRLRRARGSAEAESKWNTTDEEEDNGEENQDNDPDSEDEKKDKAMTYDDDHALTQQADFIPLG